jgi:probable HAF family extracellular repeat protein
LHAFFYDGTQMNDLGTLGGTNSFAWALNDSGQVVGRSDIAGGAQHAFLYDGTGLHDLNALIPPNTGWVLQVAEAINDAGQIAGYGTFNGQTEAFLLTPLGASSPAPPAGHPAAHPLSPRRAAPTAFVGVGLPLGGVAVAPDGPAGAAPAPAGAAASPFAVAWLSPAVTALLQRTDAPSGAVRAAPRAPVGPATLDQLFTAWAAGQTTGATGETMLV